MAKQRPPRPQRFVSFKAAIRKGKGLNVPVEMCGDGLGLFSASCRFCCLPLRFSECKRRDVLFTNLECTPGRTIRCCRAALVCRQFGPNQ